MAFFGKANDRAKIWEQWFAENLDSLMLYTRWQSRNQTDAEDILQRVLAKLWKSFKKDDVENLHAIVCSKIKLAAIDFYRSLDRQKAREKKYGDFAVIDGSAAHGSWFENFAEAKDIQKTLLAELYRLPENQQEIVILSIWNKLSFREISKVTGSSKSTVSDHYQSAMQTLKQRLKGVHEVCNL